MAVSQLNRLRLALWVAATAFLIFGLWVTRGGSRWPSLYYMTGPSMEPGLAAGDYFLAWGPAGRFSPGDLVIFRFVDEDGEFHVLRRVAGLPGDTVEMRDGVVVRNGVPESWPFQILKRAASTSPLSREGNLYDWGPWVVPPDSALLLSDTRDMVGWPDSRFIGFVALDDILARATMTLSGRSLR